ncbi:putative DNA-directed RNA polymerase III subunit RPC4 [Lupinus albus]|uniref:Putative DNA-directed RNA polymerase III subunit RPC4 n=1 Tax=Lupinus albus TaxID=3870 RepID=A0A6A4NWQ3_LUPAL|nr:putative DNA-directed RNA polymerase III subunit RPC4 [Lupinus albus]
MDSQNNVAALRRKLKFAPKAPLLRKPKPKVKTEVVDNVDSVQARDLLRRFNENSMKARPKVEKKVSTSQIAFGDGGAANSFKSYGFPKDGSNINGSQTSASNVEREK